MKRKILITILLLNIFAISCAAISKNAPTDEQIEYIKRASIKLNTTRMKKAWRNICKNDSQACSEKQKWFDKILYETEVRKHDVQSIMLNQPIY